MGLTGFERQRGNVYCGVHITQIYTAALTITKLMAAEKIRKKNPVVVDEKIQKI